MPSFTNREKNWVNDSESKRKKMPTKSSFFIFISLSIVFGLSFFQNIHAESLNQNEDVVHETFQENKKEIARDTQLELIRKTILELKIKIYTILSEKPGEISSKEKDLLEFFESDLQKNRPDFLETYHEPIKNPLQYFEFKNDLVESKKDFLDFNLETMKVSFYENGIKKSEEIISGKGRPGSWWETPPGLYYAQDKREMVKLTLSKEDNPIFMPKAIRFSGLFFIHRWPEYENGKKLPGYYTEGCLRLNDVVSEKVYNFVSQGMPILIYDKVKKNITYEKIEQYVHNENILSSQKYFIADLDSNDILLSKNEKRKVFLGDITKLILMLTATEWIEVKIKKPPIWLNTVTQYFPETRLEEGVDYSLLDLGPLMLAEKSLAATEEISDRLWGDKLDLMSQKSHSIGMKNFRYQNYRGDKMENEAAMEDIFYLLKNLYINRNFILEMTMNNAENSKYEENIFKGKLSVDSLWKDSEGYRGGITGIDNNGNEYGAGIFRIEIQGEIRRIAFIVFDSQNIRSDVEIMKGFVKFYYD